MTFTYLPTAPDPTTATLARLRLELGDTDPAHGVRPDGSNLTDEELTLWLSAANGDVSLATALAADALARIWATAADLTLGPRREALSAVSAHWAACAVRLHARHATLYTAFSLTPRRD